MTIVIDGTLVSHSQTIPICEVSDVTIEDPRLPAYICSSCYHASPFSRAFLANGLSHLNLLRWMCTSCRRGMMVTNSLNMKGSIPLLTGPLKSRCDRWGRQVHHAMRSSPGVVLVLLCIMYPLLQDSGMFRLQTISLASRVVACCRVLVSQSGFSSALVSATFDSHRKQRYEFKCRFYA